LRNKQKEIESWGCRTLFFLHFVLLFCVVDLSAQAPDTLWTKIYGGVNDDGAHSVQQTSDGGYIVVGYTMSFGPGFSNVWLLKTDANGDTIWTTTYGGDNIEYSYSVKQTFDDGYIIAGRTNSFGAGDYDIYLVKTKPDVGVEETENSKSKIQNPRLAIYPNPFSDKTVISVKCSMPSNGSEITLRIYDLSGRSVKSFPLTTDYLSQTITAQWDGKDNSGKKVPGGIYFLRFVTGKYNATRKLLKIR